MRGRSIKGEPAQQLPANALEQWRKAATLAGFTDFVATADGSTYRTNRPGIYFWLAANGEAYVGQSIRPKQRLRAHMKAHGDLIAAAFQPCAKRHLDTLEAELVRQLGKSHKLRNIKLAAWTCSKVPLDDVLSAEEQLAFIQGQALPRSVWQTFPEQERLHERRFRQFVDAGGSDALRALQIFVERAVPRPEETELSFWSVTLLPAQKMLRVNVGQQEVFTVEFAGRRAVVRILTAKRVRLFGSWRMPYQVESYVNSLPATKLGSWLNGQRLVSARELVLRLMRHTQPLNSRSHCPQALRQSPRQG